MLPTWPVTVRTVALRTITASTLAVRVLATRTVALRAIVVMTMRPLGVALALALAAAVGPVILRTLAAMTTRRAAALATVVRALFTLTRHRRGLLR